MTVTSIDGMVYGVSAAGGRWVIPADQITYIAESADVGVYLWAANNGDGPLPADPAADTIESVFEAWKGISWPGPASGSTAAVQNIDGILFGTSADVGRWVIPVDVITGLTDLRWDNTPTTPRIWMANWCVLSQPQADTLEGIWQAWKGTDWPGPSAPSS